MKGGGVKTVPDGDGVSLECSPPKGYPQPTVTWLYEGRELSANGLHILKYTQYEGGLFIDACMKEDSGTYECVASNEAGSRNITWKLNVHEFSDDPPTSVFSGTALSSKIVSPV